MKKYLFAAVIASTALFGLSVQAAPVTSNAATLHSQVTGSVEKVWHCRHWSGGWGCGGGWHNRWRSHHRWGSHHW